MPDVIDLNDALRVYLPKTFELPPDVTLTDFQWFLHDRLPGDRTYPYGTYELLNTSPRGPGRKQTRRATLVLVEATDTPTFTTGTMSYLLVQQDVESITTVTGTLAATPGHVFVEGTDYELDDDDKTLVWLPAGDEPDNGTVFTVVYDHRKYRRQFGADGTVTVRLHVVAKDYAGPTRKFDKSQIAWLLALATEQYLRLNSGRVLSSPPSNAPVPFHLEAAAGHFLSSNKEYVDPSEGINSWAVDFQVRASYILQNPATEAILSLGITPEIVP